MVMPDVAVTSNRPDRCFDSGKPIISVVTVVYNAAKELPETIRSVKNQSYENIEYIVVDGASTDGTLNVIKENETFIYTWLSEPDNGVYDAMNKALKYATGDWVIFLGAGDILLNVLHDVAIHLTDPLTVYYGDVYQPGKHRIYAGRFNRHKLSRINIPHQAIFYPKQLLTEKQFELKYRIMADYVFNIQVYGAGRFNFECLRMLIAIYEDAEGLSSCNRDMAFDSDHYRILQENFGATTGYEYAIREFLRTIEREYLRKGLRKLKGLFSGSSRRTIG